MEILIKLGICFFIAALPFVILTIIFESEAKGVKDFMIVIIIALISLSVLSLTLGFIKVVWAL